MRIDFLRIHFLFLKISNSAPLITTAADWVAYRKRVLIANDQWCVIFELTSHCKCRARPAAMTVSGVRRFGSEAWRDRSVSNPDFYPSEPCTEREFLPIGVADDRRVSYRGIFAIRGRFDRSRSSSAPEFETGTVRPSGGEKFRCGGRARARAPARMIRKCRLAYFSSDALHVRHVNRGSYAGKGKFIVHNAIFRRDSPITETVPFYRGCSGATGMKDVNERAIKIYRTLSPFRKRVITRGDQRTMIR